jgi:anti-sigma B factor antagonist
LVVELSVHVRAGTGGAVVIAARGDVDHATAALLRGAVTEALRSSPVQICLDLGGVAFMDSSGIGALVAARRAAEQAGARLTVENPSAFVHRLLAMVHIAEYFGLGGASS